MPKMLSREIVESMSSEEQDQFLDECRDDWDYIKQATTDEIDFIDYSQIDELIREDMQNINSNKWIITRYCCQGHILEDGSYDYPYIVVSIRKPYFNYFINVVDKVTKIKVEYENDKIKMIQVEYGLSYNIDEKEINIVLYLYMSGVYYSLENRLNYLQEIIHNFADEICKIKL